VIAVNFREVPLRLSSWFSILISSALFGALHGAWLAGTLVGLLYCAAFARRGSLADSILAHATTNALLAAFVLATGDWSLWA
jgi:CAAX prenyl protease-like protein